MVRKLFEAKLMPAISAKNSAGALALHVELLTSATGDMSAWVPGVKFLTIRDGAQLSDNRCRYRIVVELIE
jgi:hypothetical protein